VVYGAVQVGEAHGQCRHLGVGHDNFSGTGYYNFSDCVVVSFAHDFLVAGSAPLTSKVASFFSTPSPLLTKPVVHDYKFLLGSKN
jgi:hypothetical protein